MLKRYGNIEINDLQLIQVLRNEYISRFNVSMANLIFMQKPNSFEKLLHDLLDGLLRYRCWLCCSCLLILHCRRLMLFV